MEDEIDLREYVLALMKYWKQIVGITFLVAVAAFGITSLLPKTYDAKSLVVVTSPRYILNFEPKIETANQTTQKVNPKAYLGLATSDGVLTQLLADPALDSLKPEDRTLDRLRDNLTAKAGADPTLLELTVSDTDPAHAAEIANAWGRVVVEYINDVYGRTADTQAFFDAQAVSANSGYEAAQRDLEDFVGHNRLAELQREIDIRQTLINQYKTEQTASQGLALSQQLQSRRQILANMYVEQVGLEQLLADAQALREQVQKDVGATAANAGNALALVLLRQRAFSGFGTAQLQPAQPSSTQSQLTQPQLAQPQPIQLQIALPSMTETVAIADVNNLIAVLKTRQIETQARIDAASADLLGVTLVTGALTTDDAVSQLLKQYSDEMLALSAQLEAESAHYRDLVQTRDLALETYTAVRHKAEETRLAAQSGEAEVQFASAASAPDKASGPSRLKNTALAGTAALMLTVVAVFGWEWWRGEVKSQKPEVRS